jgi:hypothetical protein
MNPNRPATSERVKNTALILLLSLLALTSGCKTASLSDPVTGSGYRPQNFYRSLGQLPVNIRRVAVLPTTCDDNISDVQHGRDLLESVITEELAKTKKFELIVVTPDQLRVWTGRTSWRAEEPLPADFLKVLKSALACDAVLFGRVSQYRAYPPLTVGLSFKLADVHTGDFIWAVDEVFDSSEPSVVNSARRYQLMREQLPASLADSRSILNSPGGFGRYAANSVFETLPAR